MACSAPASTYWPSSVRARSVGLAWASTDSSAGTCAGAVFSSCVRRPVDRPTPMASTSTPSSMDCWKATTRSSSALRCSASARCCRACCRPYSDIARPDSTASDTAEAAASATRWRRRYLPST
ncbi:MAG: hypothetical protein A2X76_09185 [Lysobacterales bacterium GWF1_69_6]|nr:MAG: hypothetical protein A2X76_09185 [Xanthomonadales bacterium GWF1_69_6]